MNIFVKTNSNWLPALTIALIVGSGLMTAACSSAAESRSANGNSAAAAQNKSVAVDNKPAGKTPNNKAVAAPNESVAVYDGRDEEGKAKEATAAEKQSVEKEFKRREAVIMEKSEIGCNDGEAPTLDISGVAEGSFTAPNSSQKAFLYEWCHSGGGFGVGGIVILENEKVAAHYSYGDSGLYQGISSLSDVNKNGFSELVFVGGGSGQGYTSGTIDMFEFKGGNPDFLGRAETYSDNSGAGVGKAMTETIAYKISVEPSANPTFLHEKYEQKQAAGKWSLIGKAAKFSLDKSEAVTFIKIS